MAPASQPPEATELVYVPAPSWLPLLAAAGIAMILAGLFLGWVVMIIGALFLIAALWSWIGRTRTSLARLPRRQRPVTAVLPAVPPRRPAAK